VADLSQDAAVDAYFALMSEKVRSVDNLRFYLRYLYDGIPLNGKRVLDVGAASNARYSLYAACRGATEVVALKAHDAGSTAGSLDDLSESVHRLDLHNVVLVSGDLVKQNLPTGAFDVLLLYASVNHLDEDACMRLQSDPDAVDIYLGLFNELARVAAPGGKVVIVDCSPRNLFARVGKNPLAPAIEWEKHQPPELWAGLLESTGFTRPRVRWNSFNTLRSPGRLLLGNRLAAYCLTSVFCLTMTRV
jgi:SAM-dependent methyltransferase